jgi:hypothetical protein
VLFFHTSPVALRQLWISWAPAKLVRANAPRARAILFKLVITIFSFFGIKAALLRAYKTYASGSVHQNSVTAIVPQHNGISSGEVRQTNTIFTLLI